MCFASPTKPTISEAALFLLHCTAVEKWQADLMCWSFYNFLVQNFLPMRFCPIEKSSRDDVDDIDDVDNENDN